MRKKSGAWILLAAIACFAGPAFAQLSKIQISDDQKLVLEAIQFVVHRDWKNAETLYSQAIGINSNNIEAWLQRGVVRREMGDEAGSESDAGRVVALANAGLQANSNDPTLYHQRGMAERLLKNFSAARRDIGTAIRLSGNTSWDNDLKAAQLEEKEALSRTEAQ